jgi:methylated-DNA-[protein]-cysteine S-methyltransferase
MSVRTDDVAVAALDTPVGTISIAVTPEGLADLGWGGTDRLVARAGIPVVSDPPRVDPMLGQLREYFRGDRTTFELPLDWRHVRSDAPLRVLQTLHRAVDFGTTVTYGELARLSGTGIPARGIGAVMASNPIAIVVPCHRVVAHDGLGGYSGGPHPGSGRDRLEVKRWLLMLEGALAITLDWDLAGLPARAG